VSAFFFMDFNNLLCFAGFNEETPGPGLGAGCARVQAELAGLCAPISQAV
jgi:hypothetical protein